MSELVDFERFLTRKYNSSKITAVEYAKVNMILQEFWDSQTVQKTNSEVKNG